MMRADRAILSQGRQWPPSIGLERMLRLHFLQHWFDLSDPAAEEALYDSLSMRAFVGVDLGREPVPDETTILNFRHRLERHGLGKALFDQMNEYLASRDLKVAGGTIVDATLIAAPSSTKNQAKARDPEMHQARKGQQWCFGMKLHIGPDSRTKLIHSLLTTAVNVHDGKVLGALLHGNERRVYGDQAYRGQRAALRQHAPNAKDFTLAPTEDFVRFLPRSTSSGRTPVLRDQADLWVCQSPLPGPGEEHRAAMGDVRTDQPPQCHMLR